jgi:hypothetical protein
MRVSRGIAKKEGQWNLLDAMRAVFAIYYGRERLYRGVGRQMDGPGRGLGGLGGRVGGSGRIDAFAGWRGLPLCTPVTAGNAGCKDLTMRVSRGIGKKGGQWKLLDAMRAVFAIYFGHERLYSGRSSANGWFLSRFGIRREGRRFRTNRCFCGAGHGRQCRLQTPYYAGQQRHCKERRTMEAS